LRYAAVTAFIVIAAVVGALGYRVWMTGPPVVLAAPHGLSLQIPGGAIGPGDWTNSPTVDLLTPIPAADGGSGGSVSNTGAELEVRPISQTFTGSPTLSIPAPGRLAVNCGSCSAAPLVRAHIHLADGSYHWQARLRGDRGVSPWVQYRGVIRIDTRPPTISSLASPTDPVQGTTYHSSTLRFTWQGTDSGSGIDGYSYRLDSDPHGSARPELRTRATDVTLEGLTTGTWYFHVAALDRAGNWGPSVILPVKIDVTPPGLSRLHFSRYQFDPQFQGLQVSFALTRPAREVRVGVYDQRSGGLVRLYTLRSLSQGQNAAITWDGKDAHGALAAAGSYEIYLRAVDAYGHSSLNGWRDFLVEYKRIVVSLSQQKLTAYNGNSVFLTSLVTTGNPKLPTPQGTFTILAKFHPFTFHSPWPKSSPLYYPPSLTQWTMLFQAGGYFIHDAPWRSVFGPGSNQQIGTPGQNYTGTHGCVNVPSDVAYKLFQWAPIGTVVQVVS
jgi:lipoprotein-anchoring transpeptidase ErfK/SrfK